MKPRLSREQLDTLLGRGGIGATRRDTILENVLARVQATSPARRFWRWTFAGLGVAATVAALFLLIPRLSQPALSPFRAKGATPPTVKPTAWLECLGATLRACPTGSLLAVQAMGVRGYLSAWAQPVAGGERIWYFSAETSSPLVEGSLPASDSPQRAVKVGPEHAAGSYVVEIRVTKRPLNHEEILRASDGEMLVASQATLTVVASP
jgi:hypothetical protein